MPSDDETLPADLDALLLDALEEDLLAVLLTPPRVPSFALGTIRPVVSS